MDTVCTPQDVTGISEHRLRLAAVWGGVIAAVYLLYTFNPASSALYVPCPLNVMTGLYCPGCGSLRALHQLLHGHLKTAFGLNPLMVLSLPFLGYSLVSYMTAGIRGHSLPHVFVPARFIWIYLGVVLVFWVIRNIPQYPFSLLAP